MARLPRLDLAGHLHLVIQQGRDDRAVFVDDEDRRRYLSAMLDSSRESALAIHAYALTDRGVLLLATPPQPASLARFVQAVGRRYVKAFNRRHGRSGALWEGRYRSTVLDPASRLMECVHLVEQAPVREGLVARAVDWPWSSAAHHAGLKADPIVTEHAAYWQLGNTPFEREARHATSSASLLATADARHLLEAARRGWPVGSHSFIGALAQETERPLQPRRRGRKQAKK